jgi:MinD superfamily P-loop ATPase
MKQVVIASGKGGTGKTTVTATLAHLSAAHYRVVVADADVEASNLPLALHPHDVSCEAFSGGATAEIDQTACTACGLCADVCRFDAVSLADTGEYRVDPFQCEGCGRCERDCPSSAIAMKPSTVGEACRGETDIGSIAFGQLGPGEDLSGRLVTEVRRRATDAGAASHADLILIDGPPGVGCPLISAVASTDLLVAVAEPSVSGAHDLGRLADLAARVNVPLAVLLNKADLSAEGAEGIRTLCRSRNLELIAEVPFDEAGASYLAALAQRSADSDLPHGPFSQQVARAWNSIQHTLELHASTSERADS